MIFIQIVFQELSGKPLSFRECFDLVKHKFLPSLGLLVSIIGLFLLFVIASVLLVLPVYIISKSLANLIFLATVVFLGILAYLGSFFALEFVVLRGNSIGGSLKNSWQLFKSNAMRTMGYAIVTLLMFIFLSFVLFAINNSLSELLLILEKEVNVVNSVLFILLTIAAMFVFVLYVLLPTSFFTSFFLDLTTPASQAVSVPSVPSEPVQVASFRSPREMPVNTILKKPVKRKPAPALKRITKKKK